MGESEFKKLFNRYDVNICVNKYESESPSPRKYLARLQLAR